VSTIASPWAWGALLVLVVVAQAVDFRKPARRSEAAELRSALGYSLLWVLLALSFAAYLHGTRGSEVSVTFLTAYLIEKSLSLDNVFVFAVIFSTLGIPAALQRRVLAWGVVGALVLRTGMVLAGAALMARFHWLHYVFGALLLLTGAKLLVRRSEAPHAAEESRLLLALQRYVPHTRVLHGERLWVREAGRLLATPLLLALVLVELCDVLFALDSVPAVFAVTSDPFLVLSSNAFAILGLRSLYYVLSRAMERFRQLSRGLAVVLVFVGAKLCLTDLLHVPPAASLVIVALALGGSMLLSRPSSAAPSATERPKQGGRSPTYSES
jgi:tellurite resistance protein TerC